MKADRPPEDFFFSSNKNVVSRDVGSVALCNVAQVDVVHILQYISVPFEILIIIIIDACSK